MSGKSIYELRIGMTAELTRTYDEWDINTFAALTGDLNPAHVDRRFAEASIFKERIAHGMLTASLISAVLGMKLPGPGSIYLSQDLRFLRPVRIGDTITARVEVVEIMQERNLVRLRTTCANQHGDLVLDGIALVMPPAPRATPSTPEASASEGAGGLPQGVRPSVEVPRAPRPGAAALLVGDWMRPNPLTISPNATLADARALFTRHGIRHLPVVEGTSLKGIVTERDIRQASLPGPPGRPESETEALLGLIRVEAVMTRQPVTVAPWTTIGEAARLLLARRIGALPVLEDERLVGIITETDLLEALVAIVGS
jgi:3-hydroxybutyryl-CoA dehydratase